MKNKLYACIFSLVLILVFVHALRFVVFPVYAPLENFTEYTEVDADGNLDFNATHIDHYVQEDEDSYLYNNSYSFGDYFWSFDFQYDNESGTPLGWLAFSTSYTTIQDRKAIYDANGNYTAFRLRPDNGDHYLVSVNKRVLTSSTVINDLSTGTWYYATLNHTGTSLTLELYNDTIRTGVNLTHTRTITLPINETHTVLYPTQMRDRNNVAAFDLDFANFDLNYAWPTVPYPNVFGVSTHQANTSCTFYSNWTADNRVSDFDPSINMSHWIFGSNMSRSFVNNTIRGFGGDFQNGSVNVGTPGGTMRLVFGNNYAGGVLKINDYLAPFNVTSIQLNLLDIGNPNFNLSVTIHNASTLQNVYGSNMSLTQKYGLVANSTNKVNSTSIGIGFYTFYFSGFTMEYNMPYGICVTVEDWVSGDSSNRIDVSVSDDIGNGNYFWYYPALFVGVLDLRHIIGGYPLFNSPTWANVTRPLSPIVGETIQYQFWANNTDGFWNTTGLLSFVTNGINLTFRFNTGGFLYLSFNDGALTPLANNTNKEYCQGSHFTLLAAPLNATYRWNNFTWDDGNTLINNYTFSTALSIEGYTYFSYSSISVVYFWCTAAFNWSLANPNPNQTVTFDGTYSNSSHAITNWSWNFGDGNTTAGAYSTITHDYVANGTYTITLTITNSASNTSNLQEFILVGGAIAINYNPRFFAAAIAAFLIGIPLLLIVVAVIKKR